jgi:hypothetical protein
VLTALAQKSPGLLESPRTSTSHSYLDPSEIGHSFAPTLERIGREFALDLRLLLTRQQTRQGRANMSTRTKTYWPEPDARMVAKAQAENLVA